jgi:pimeloyl-ACP methyl ester carboxylesterase
MIDNTPGWYIFIRLCVFFLHYLTPICLAYTILSIAFYGFAALRFPVPIVIEAVAVAETLFYLLVVLPYKRYFQKDTIHPPTLSRPERKVLFEKCNATIADPDGYLSKWFLGANPDDIRRDNLVEFILWAFFNRGGPVGEDAEEVEEYIQLHERTFHRSFAPGRNPDVKCLKLTLDDVELLHRSLVWYFCVAFVDFLTFVNFRVHKFQHFRSPLKTLALLFPVRLYALLTRHVSPVKTSYWHRPHRSKDKLPILFLHGIGIGLYPYANFLEEIHPDIGVLALEIMNISFRLSPTPPLSSSELVTEIRTILKSHGYDRVVLCTHSYGSVVATHLLQSEETQDMIADIVLVDPVSILLHLPDVATNFVHRRPRTAAEWQLWYFASKDLGVAHTLGRHFFWSRNCVWKEDLGVESGRRRVTVSLAGRDLIVDTEAVGRYVAGCPPHDGPLPTGGDRRGGRIGAAASAETSAENTDLDDGLPGEEDTRAEDERAALVGEGWKHKAWRGRGLEILWFDRLDHAQVFDKRVTRAKLIQCLDVYCSVGKTEVNGTANGRAEEL